MPDSAVEHRPDGTWLLRSRTPIGPCERAADGGWRRVTDAEVWAAARAIGQGLLGRGLGPGRPVLVLSGNGVDHGLLMLGCDVAGVPIVPVSVA